MQFILLISWGVCSQSALPLKSYRGAENNPMWDSRCIDSILLSCTNPPPTQSSSSHDLVAYSLTSSFNFHLSGNLEHFCSLRHIVVDIHYKNLMLMPSKYADVRVIFRGLWASCSSSSSHWLYIIHTSYTAACFRTSKILLVPPSCALYSSTVTVLSLSMPHTGRLYLLSDSDETFKSITFCTSSFSWPRLKAAFHD